LLLPAAEHPTLALQHLLEHRKQFSTRSTCPFALALCTTRLIFKFSKPSDAEKYRGPAEQTQPMPRTQVRFKPLNSVPASVIDPESVFASPTIDFNVVVLPTPLRPSGKPGSAPAQ